jgi:hypothetical protein
MTLPATIEEFTAGLGSDFRSYLRRRRKRLLAKGEVTTEHITCGADVASRLEEGYALEKSGWKGRAGTAIAQSGETHRFYTELARFAEQEGHLSLHFLRLNGEAVAFQYGLVYDNKYCLLKPAYNEEYGEASPGQLLMEDVLKYCINSGITEYHFLGPETMWKRKWARDTEDHTWLFIFPKNAYGRLLHNYKFRWVPAAKKAAMRWRRP